MHFLLEKSERCGQTDGDADKDPAFCLAEWDGKGLGRVMERQVEVDVAPAGSD